MYDSKKSTVPLTLKAWRSSPTMWPVLILNESETELHQTSSKIIEMHYFYVEMCYMKSSKNSFSTFFLIRTRLRIALAFISLFLYIWMPSLLEHSTEHVLLVRPCPIIHSHMYQAGNMNGEIYFENHQNALFTFSL